ncbi:MAG: DUF4339 domain-containing protein [Candidatus Nealsonbacteria bacterium]|nr:DUF4339 domain-containing protein [Candidatus Nealsonbacteria bacterium]
MSEAGDVVWYVRPASGGQFGPAGNEVMRGWIGEGRVSADSLVWREGWRDWQEAAEVFPQLKAAPVSSPLDQIPIAASLATVARSAQGTSRRRSSATHAVAIILLIFAVLILLAVFVWVLFRDPPKGSRGPGNPRPEIVIRDEFNPTTVGPG